jgi:hypothetical protein
MNGRNIPKRDINPISLLYLTAGVKSEYRLA